MSLTEAVRSRRVGHLELDGFVSAEETTPVREVLYRMRQCDCMTVLVLHEGRLAGIFTERDALRKVLTRPETWDTPVGEWMSREPVTARPEQSLLDALRAMRGGQFRNLPVVGPAGEVLGNLTDTAVVRGLADYLQVEVLNLPPDPNQVPKTVEGA